MTLHEILQYKGTEVHTIGPAATLEEAVEDLVRYNVGSLVVCEATSKGMDTQLIGIVTERDILRTLAGHKGSLAKLQVADVMSTELITALPQDRIAHAMGLMTKNRVRHLPIVEEGRVLGIISIGDVVKAHHDQMTAENYYMKSYIQGEGAEVATPLDPQ